MQLSRRHLIATTLATTAVGLAASPARAHQRRKAALVEAVRRTHLLRRRSYAAGQVALSRDCALWLLTAYERFTHEGLTRFEARNVCHAGYFMSKRDYRTPRDPFFQV